MGEKMASRVGLTARQKQFLAVVLQTPYLLKRFYLSGGTVLSNWYLHHRDSYDLDFFSDKEEVNKIYLSRWFRRNQLTYPNGDKLKVDFSYYPSQRIEKGLNWQGLEIDSLYDIAVNKLETLSMSPRAKDYIDLYFIFKNKKYDLDKLRRDSRIKFEIEVDTIHLARQFLRVKEFKDWPRLYRPLKEKDLVEFYERLAKNMASEIFK